MNKVRSEQQPGVSLTWACLRPSAASGSAPVQDVHLQLLGFCASGSGSICVVVRWCHPSDKHKHKHLTFDLTLQPSPTHTQLQWWVTVSSECGTHYFMCVCSSMMSSWRLQTSTLGNFSTWFENDSQILPQDVLPVVSVAIRWNYRWLSLCCTIWSKRQETTESGLLTCLFYLGF